MPNMKCRVCGHDLFKEPLLQYANMPKGAQYLPGPEDLKDDKGVNLDIYQCTACGLVQLSNPPVSYHREVIRAAAFSPEMRDFRIKQFSDFIERFSLRGKKVVEIGCGHGEYLNLIRDAGADAHGLEYGEQAVAYCRRSGLNVSRGFLGRLDEKIPQAPFDAFFAMSFLEHLPQPDTLLGAMANNLVDGGVGLVEVPNFDMNVRENLFSEFIGDHLLYFTRDTLATALTLHGFEVLDCREVWHDYIISARVRKSRLSAPDPGRAVRLDLSPFQFCQKELKRQIQQYLEYYEDGKVAVWGAGHQALAVMALSDLGGKIRYVIDAASFKQGRYTPATHIPIVPPETLNTDPVDAVIIMAGSYCQEVARIIRERFDRRIDACWLNKGRLEVV